MAESYYGQGLSCYEETIELEVVTVPEKVA